jgi:4-hydroxy-tetrahydrodipicolinate reductase
MKFALIGYGKMGRMIEKAAINRGHEIVARLSSEEQDWSNVTNADICIEFSHPDCVLENIKKAAELHKGMIIGTTGWDQHIEEVRSLAAKYQIGMVYSPNFSLGVHLMQNILQNAARIMNPFDEYDVAGIEYHHKAKKDSPSGTALALAKSVEAHMDRVENLAFSSIRCGSIPGTHSIIFDSFCDTITITHEARNREGFAKGAVVAAEWLDTKKGFYSFSTCINEIIQGKRI